MNLERMGRLLAEKENIHLEFKTATNTLPANLFETICAMLNRDGGDILLGVEDNGKVLGVNETQPLFRRDDLSGFANGRLKTGFVYQSEKSYSKS